MMESRIVNCRRILLEAIAADADAKRRGESVGCSYLVEMIEQAVEALEPKEVS